MLEIFKDRRDPWDQPVQPAHKALKDFRVRRVQPVLPVRKDSLVLPVHRDQQEPMVPMDKLLELKPASRRPEQIV
jgi:hypothetical protein